MKLNHFCNRALVWAFVYLAVMLCRVPGQTKPAPATTNESGTVRVLVAYHSLTGNTEKMADGVVEGVKRIPGVAVSLKKWTRSPSKTWKARTGSFWVARRTTARFPGQMKVIIDDWSWKMKVDFTDKVGGAFSTGGGQVGGKEFVVVSLVMFMLSNRMVVAGPLYRNDKTGSVWGKVGAAAMTGPLDPGVSEGELDSARRLGERVARLAAKLKGAAQEPR